MVRRRPRSSATIKPDRASNRGIVRLKEPIMPAAIPENFRDLFDKKVFASLATLMPDGKPQVTPVWVDFDGEHVIFNSARGRQKDKNVRRDPRVALAVV